MAFAKMVRSARFFVLGLLLMCCPPHGLAATVNPQETATKATYLIIYRPGPAWLTGKSVTEQPLKEHGKYMLSLYIKGSMRLAGPLTDNTGGAVLLDVSDEAEAKAIVANDPAVKSGIFVYEMHPWKLQPWDEFAKKAKGAAETVRPTTGNSVSGADVGRTQLDEESLRSYMVGEYDLIGRKPDSTATYAGRVTLRDENGVLQVTRTIEGKTDKCVARFDTVAGDDRIPVLKMHFHLDNREYDAAYRWQSDLDNYPRFTGYVYLPGTKSPGLEALFPIHR
jgi:uncharacterized protein YciI